MPDTSAFASAWRTTASKRPNALAHTALLESGIWIQDPFNQPNLRTCKKLPTGLQATHALNRYNHRNGYVLCQACGRTNHYKGMTVEFEDGSIALIGNCCLNKYFGDSAYETLERQLKEQEDRIIYNRLLLPYLSKIGPALEILETITEKLKIIDNLHKDFCRKFSNLSHKLRLSVDKNNGVLNRTSLATDYARIERTSHHGSQNQKDYKKEIVQATGTIQGGLFISHSRTASDLFSDARSSLKGARKKLEDCPATNKELEAISVQIKRAKNLLIDLQKFFAATHDFWNRKHLQFLLEWASHADDINGQYLVGSDYIEARFTDPYDEDEHTPKTSRLSIPTQLPTFPDEVLRLLDIN